MAEPRTPTGRMLDRIVEQLQDHQALLADFGARLETHANEIIVVWSKAYHEIVATEPLSAEATSLASPEKIAPSFFGELKQGNLRQALLKFAQWSQGLAFAGWSNDLGLYLIREYQRATLGFVVRIYSEDPRLPLALDALDGLFDSVAAIVGAVHVEAIQTRVASATRLQVLGQLSSGTAHSLNNLLAAIHGRAQFLLERVSDHETRDELQEIQNTAALGAQMVRRIQDYERTDQKDKRATDINLLLRDAAEITRFLWRDQTEIKGVVIDIVKDFADVPPVLVQPTAVRQAFVALILNAIEAMPNGGLITLRTERKGDLVLALIVDNGTGMPEDVLAHAPDSFFTTKALPHLGLGLPTVAQTVADQNGTLAIESKPAHGTLVIIGLPIAQGVAETKGAKPVSAKRNANILIIDNEPPVRNLLARLLKMEGHDVATADQGPEGVAAFKKGKFDIVITDLGMPGMSGWQVAREVKKLNPTVCVVLTTGWSVEMTPEERKEQGIDHVIAKPFDMPQLFGLIGEALASRGKK